MVETKEDKRLNAFTFLYPVSKTLRFSLLPQGRTEENIQKNKLLVTDKKRAEDYEKIKSLLDSYHKKFIEEVLQKSKFNWKRLATALQEYQKEIKNDEAKEKELLEAQKDVRREVRKAFENYGKEGAFNKLLSPTPKELFKSKEFLEGLTKEEKGTVASFSKFSTYFTGFQETRQNIYSEEEIATAIPFRIVNDNFPKFFQNEKSFNEIKHLCPEVLKEEEEELGSLLGKGGRLEEIFLGENYNNFLSQKGISFYNQVIGGVSGEEGKRKIRGINECINQYWQKNLSFAREHKKIKLLPLFKQILSDRETYSFQNKAIKSDKELIEALKSAESSFESVFPQLDEVERKLKNATSDTLSNIYINKKDLNFLSQLLFSNTEVGQKWAELQRRFNLFAENSSLTKKEKERYLGEIEESASKKKGTFSLLEINNALSFKEEGEGKEKTQIKMQDYFSGTKDFTAPLLEKWKEVLKKIEELPETVSIKEEKGVVSLIKDYLDSVMDYYHKFKLFMVKSNNEERDSDFYEVYEEACEGLSIISSLYNRVRDYTTKKFDTEGKYKLNFDNATLANGWDLNKEGENSCVILLKGGKYYLGIINVHDKVDFTEAKSREEEEECYKKMVYKLLPGPNKMLPKVFFSKKGQLLFTPPKDLLEDYKQGKHKKGETFDLSFCHRLIDYFKSSIAKHPDWSVFNFKFSPTSSYNDISDFYREVAEQGYKVTFSSVSAKTIESWVTEGKLYLFEIYNKDFSTSSSGRPNLHTLYWNALFSPKNLLTPIFKLNGEAELFYRETAIKKPIKHEKGQMLVNRMLKNGETLSDTLYLEIFEFVNKRRGLESLTQEAKKLLNQVTIKEARHTIIKDKRYTRPQFLFHVPITINYSSNPMKKPFNLLVREYLKNNKEVNIIGLDRGERNLIYLSLIDRKGKIVLQKSFNVVDSDSSTKKQSVDYREKLDKKERERDEARKNWTSIGKIAQLKEGYLSIIIHEVAKLMIEYNAIVVLEDLNFGFKRGRFHVEKQVYQKFEKMLIDKLNYLVFKDKDEGEAGSVMQGFQLTDKFTSFKALGKQTGFLFYVPAAYTSKIDSVTGFVNLLPLTSLTNMKKKKDFFTSFISIYYDKKTSSFAFNFDYKDFEGKGKSELPKTNWTLFSRGERIIYDPKAKASFKVKPTDILKELFNKYKIDYQGGENLIKVISSITDLSFFDTLYKTFKAILQMRNSSSLIGEDYIISPVMQKDGTFFDTREFEKDSPLPCDADANGAYNIALKGLFLLNRIDKAEDLRDQKLLTISNKDWFNFYANKE